MDNIIQKHIKRTEKNFKKYFSIILKNKYDRTIADEFIQTYIDARYYNYGVNPKIKVFYRRIYDALKQKGELLKQAGDKEEIIETTLSLFQYFFYFDFVRNNLSIQEVIETIDNERKTKLKLKSAENDNFLFEFTELVVSDINDAQDYIEKYNTNDFNLIIKKINPNNNNFYRVKLDYKFSFPKIFSKEAIEETFNIDVIAEDKLFVEYPLVAIEALKDILEGNFSKIYVVDFSVDLLKKQKKLTQITEILNNQASQDKIYFEINYEDFLNKKAEVFKLIKNGFKFALKTNEDMPELVKEEIKILDIFDLILVNSADINKTKYNKDKTLEI